MKFADLAIEMNQRASESFMRTARAVPQDKLHWKPFDNGRSVLELAQEVAQSATWATRILPDRAFPPFDQSDIARSQEERKAWNTLDDCERAMQENLRALYEVLRSFPEDELADRVDLPFGPGMNYSFAEMALVQYWNATYHTGQVNYIQTMLGDFEMH